MRDIRLVRDFIERQLAKPRVRWLTFIVMALGLIWFMIAVPPPFSTVVYALLCVVVVTVAARGAYDPLLKRYTSLLDGLQNVIPIPALLRYRHALAIVCATSALTLMIVSAYTFRPGTLYSVLAGAAALSGIGGVMLAAALLSIPRQFLPSLSIPAPGSANTSVRRRTTTLSGIVVLLLLAEANGRILKIEALNEVSSHAQFALLVLGVALVIIGLGNIPLKRPHLDRRTILMVGGLTLLALIVRFWHLNDSVRVFVDELAFSFGIYNVQTRSTQEILRPMEGIAAFPHLFAYWQAHAVALFGRNFIGLRAASAILGALTVPATYLLARTLFDRRVAFVSALLLAALPVHIHFSRIGISEMAGPFFGTLALAFLARGALHNRRADYAVGGAMLGMTHYFHEGSRLIYTPLALLWLAALLILWRPRLERRNLFIALLAAVIVAMPIYYTLSGLRLSLAARMVDNNSGLNADYWTQLVQTGDFDMHIRVHIVPPFLAYVNLVDSTLFYKGETALLLTAVVPAFFLGLFHALWRLRRPGMLLLILWFLAVTLGNSLMADSQGSPRFVMVFPALALLAAVGLCHTTALILPGLPRIQTFLIGLIAAVLAFTQIGFYFNEHLPIYNHQFRAAWPHPDPQDAVLRALDFPQGAQVYLISEERADQFFNRGVADFLTNGALALETIASEDFTVDTIAKLRSGVDHAFFVEPKDRRTLQLLERYFFLQPYRQSPFEDIPIERQFRLYYAPYLPGVSEQRLEAARRDLNAAPR